MRRIRPMLWLEHNWVLLAGAIAVLQLVRLPSRIHEWPEPVLSVYLLLIAYLVHQVEEHTNDRFRRFANQLVAGGREALTRRSVMVINIVGVWGGYLLLLLLVGLIDSGVGVIAAYTTLVNGLAHVGLAAVTRTYNPGLWTSLVLFLPGGAWAWAVCERTNELGWPVHALGLSIAVLSHVGILAYVRRRREVVVEMDGMASPHGEESDA